MFFVCFESTTVVGRVVSLNVNGCKTCVVLVVIRSLGALCNPGSLNQPAT